MDLCIYEYVYGYICVSVCVRVCVYICVSIGICEHDVHLYEWVCIVYHCVHTDICVHYMPFCALKYVCTFICTYMDSVHSFVSINM